MATYKVIQDVEAEDKLVGPLTLRQFIYAGIAALSGYLGFLMVSKGAPWGLVVFLPITGAFGFFAFPWGKDQPTEVWALAKLRFLFKPRRRIWDQGGAKDLVTITVPKKVEHQLTNGLNQDEVQSRLNALANTIDSRGWAVKNVNIDLGNAAITADTSDRLVQATSLPQVVSDVDVRADDDILDEQANPVAQHFDNMINAATVAHRQQLMAQMRQPVRTAPVNQPAQSSVPQAADPTAEERAMVERLKAENLNSHMSPANSHLKTIKTPEQLMAEDAARRAAAATTKPAVTPDKQAAIIELARNNDLDVATIQRQANQHADGDEVVIPLR